MAWGRKAGSTGSAVIVATVCNDEWGGGLEHNTCRADSATLMSRELAQKS